MKPGEARKELIAETAREQRQAKRQDVEHVLRMMADEHGESSDTYRALEAMAAEGLSPRSLMVLRWNELIRLGVYEDLGQVAPLESASARHHQLTELRKLAALDEPERHGPAHVTIVFGGGGPSAEERAANRGPGLVVE